MSTEIDMPTGPSGSRSGSGPGGARKSPLAAGKRRRKKVCPFCKDKNPIIDYKAVDRLKRYLSDRGKLVPRRIAGTCAKHHRELSVVIRRARTMALMPYVGSGERERGGYERGERGGYGRDRGDRGERGGYDRGERDSRPSRD